MDLDNIHSFKQHGLYHPRNEHDSCGIGAIANIKGIKSHQLIKDALTILENLEHRGGAQKNSGDGAGVLIQIPHKFFKTQNLHFILPDEGDYALAQIFLSRNEDSKKEGKEIFMAGLAECGLEFLGFREVPINPSIIGEVARNAMPYILQAFVKKPKDIAKGIEFERKLYIARRIIEKRTINVPKFYISSFSSRTVVYKGMLVSTQVSDFYLDFQNLNVESAICLVHSRFSTNTFPSWERAHPNRYMVHNGEINTINGNVNSMKAREGTCDSQYIDDLNKVFPIIAKPSSDSAMFDNTLEFLIMNGRSLEESVMLLIPEPWSKNDSMDKTKRSFYEFNSTFMEPWDGPASIIFSDGVIMGASLDRNGFRPSRYYITKDDFLILASETGALKIDESRIKEKKRLEPSKLLLVDTQKGRVISDEEIKMQYAHAKPYAKWLENLIDLDKITLEELDVNSNFSSCANLSLDSQKSLSLRESSPKTTRKNQTINSKSATRSKNTTKALHGNSNNILSSYKTANNLESIAILQRAFGYNYDELTLSIEEMARNGKEVLASMGVDTPLALLSPNPQPLFNYFKQLFAQVTNPPLDSMREKIVTSCRNYAGAEGNLLNPNANNAKRIRINRPILSNEEFYKISHLESKGFKSQTISLLFDKSELNKAIYREVNVLEEILQRIFLEANDAIAHGVQILILSDRGLDDNHLYVPSLLATSALHHHLVRTSQRTKASIIVESAEPREIHHLACLLGYGATAICPYLVYDSIFLLIQQQRLQEEYHKAVENFIQASTSGIIKIASKMGVSTLQSYNGAQIFEALGVSKKLIDSHFSGTQTHIEGIDCHDILQDVITLHTKAFEYAQSLRAMYQTKQSDKDSAHYYNFVDIELMSVGLHGYRSGSYLYGNADKEKEDHLYDPMMIYKLQHSCQNANYEEFKEYAQIVDSKFTHIRHCMDMDFSQAISINEVEGIESLVKRFKTGAMSYGSISNEAHECLAIAMNRINAQSNTGEGGEQEERFKPFDNGDSTNSAIKQVASGRFGVSINYLVNANEIQIKIAQGAKPGEGGQLPGKKVYPWIASARNSTPGVTLISPPPHHDIYSIEDLAQLIFDLKNANRNARISVKLVSESGIGTVAAGVAKAGADTILISGYDGGTGASPRTSLANAGTPWELGLAEVHQTLILNGLREKVRLEVDGKLLTGRDLAVAILLGAEDFGFATAPLVVLGCTMMRVCNLNTCPFGIATQNKELRKRFHGKPEYVVNFMHFIAQHLREYMAMLGFKNLDSMVGRSDKLLRSAKLPLSLDNIPLPSSPTLPQRVYAKARKINLDRILHNPLTLNKTHTHFMSYENLNLNTNKDLSVVLPQVKPAITQGKKVHLELEISNITGRTFGTILSSEITRIHGKKGLCKDSITIITHGNGGNSFGAFLTHGITLKVIGDVNDYLGKGLSGGKIIVHKSPLASFEAKDNIIAGNVCLYGAIEGEVYLDGIVGERFCVRNSGVTAVCLGTGQHGCEYMTGGLVVVLGDIGRNFAAGMSGGIAYIYGKHNTGHINTELVDIRELDSQDAKEVELLINNHLKYTDSDRAKKILKNFDKHEFFKVIPRDYEAMLQSIDRHKHEENPILTAFYEITGSKDVLVSSN
ncbi:glutamate synthase-related protein [Helicobacter sp. MIT 14-3879]|uniref:glutamate synthase-related protein n=1 Tax=Helicobacter sp. MIT 14-3879 TaxID=2040649 RepID=UPI002162C165|nr:glutamate synthase-related protein [Helicobacter sp. MIT 14-3879]